MVCPFFVIDISGHGLLSIFSYNRTFSRNEDVFLSMLTQYSYLIINRYTPGRLRVLAITNVPDEGEIYESSGEGLPSAVYPSDHVMLCADIAFSISDTGNVTRALAHRRNGVHRERDSGRDNSNRENGRDKSRNTRNSNNNGR
jgi:hypothetical protein